MTDSNTVMPAPRHARVLPSFAVAFVARPLESVLGLIEGPELLAWTGQALPSERTAEELREQFVRRRRVSFELLWTSVINVKIVEHWRRALTDEERLRLLPLVSSEEAVKAFPQLTLRAFKEGVRMPVGQALGILAKLEALYWIQKPWRRRTKWGAKPQCLADFPVDIEFAERMKACLASTWINELDQEDLRFPSTDKQKHSEWLSAELAKPVLSGPTHDLCLRLLAAEKASWAEELAELAGHAIETAQRRPGSEESRQRWIDIFLARHGGVSGLELQAVGDRFSITRERVRQICDAILTSLKAQPVKMPALEKLLRAAARVMPLPMQEADVQLVRFLGEGAGLDAAMAFAEEMGLESPVRRIAHGARTLAGRKPIHIVEAAAAPATWVNAALVHARRDCTFVGCTNYVRIAGLVAMEEGVALDAETLEAVFSKAPGFRILDKDSGWFTLADSEQSAAASRMRKLMCVATGSVGIDTVASALMTDDRWLYREDGRTLALPPLHVLTELFQGWNWLEANSHNKYTAKVSLDPQVLLSKSELGAIAVLNTYGGAATRAEVAAHLVGNLGVSNVAVSHVLATSSALCKLDHAIYGIGGRPLAAQALIDARARRTAEQLAHTPAAEHAGKEIDLSLPVRTTVTQSGSSVAVKRRVVYLPSYLAGKITGKFEHATQAGAAISVKSGNQIRMLAEVADDLGVGPGERFEIVFDVQKRTYEISSPATIALKSTPPSVTQQATYAPGDLSA